MVSYTIIGLRELLELAYGRGNEAVAAFRAADVLVHRLVSPQHFVPAARAMLVHALVRSGETERAGQVLAGLSQQDRERAEIRIATVALLPAQGDPRTAHDALAPVLDDPDIAYSPICGPALVHALEAAAREALGEQAEADTALERALDLAEPDGEVLPFLMYPAPGLLEALSESEIRVLRYLPTNLTTSEIARELHVSPNTVKTHIKRSYAKLGGNHRAGAVERARALGLLAPTGMGRPAVQSLRLRVARRSC